MSRTVRRGVRRPLFVAVALACAGFAQAQVETQLKDVVVSSSRVEQDIDTVPATITTIDAEDIAKRNPANLSELMDHEAGVSVRLLPRRFGAVAPGPGSSGSEGINIRGLEGDRVRLQTDGVSLPKSYSYGSFGMGRGEMIDPEGYKRVELLRGSASTQFGTDGLAGAVSFLTKDPSDLLTLGKTTQGSVKLAYASVNDSWQLAPSFAFKNDAVQGMILGSFRKEKEVDSFGANPIIGANRTTPNPFDQRSDYVLAKLVTTASKTHQFKLTLENIEKNNTTEILTYTRPQPSDYSTHKEDIKRTLVKLDYRYAPTNAFFDLLNTSIYHQRAGKSTDGIETRAGAAQWRKRFYTHDENSTGITLQFENMRTTGLPQHWVYGLDIKQSKFETLADQANLGWAPPAPPFSPMPNKPSPDTTFREIAAFAQNTVSFGKLDVTPAIRYDSSRITPHNDALYAVNNTPAPVAMTHNATSPRLGLLWKVSPLVTPFAQYARGFRAPRPTDVNGAFTGSAGPGTAYTSIPNPNLKPEYSDTVELGVRGRATSSSYSVSLFHGEYKDFITNRAVRGAGTLGDPQVFQTINLANVSISGFEARGDWRFAKEWRFSAAYAHARGDSKTTAGVTEPLDTINPDKLLFGLDYEAGRWGVQTVLTVVEGKKRNPIRINPQSPPANFAPGGYSVVDLSAWYNIDKRSSLNFALNNAFDRKYHQWADVRDLTLANLPRLDAWSQPGRNFNLSVKHQF